MSMNPQRHYVEGMKPFSKIPFARWHLYKIFNISALSGTRGEGRVRRQRNSMKECFGVDEMFWILLLVMITWIYGCVRIHRTVYSGQIHDMLIKNKNFKRKKCIKKSKGYNMRGRMGYADEEWNQRMVIIKNVELGYSTEDQIRVQPGGQADGDGPRRSGWWDREAIWTLVMLAEQGVCHSMFMWLQRLCSPLRTNIHGSAEQAQVISTLPLLRRRGSSALGWALVEKGKWQTKARHI